MNQSNCEKEKEIIAAMRRGDLELELEKHASTCVICSDLAAVSRFLQSQTAVSPVLLDSNFLWWKAQLATQRMAMERATRSIALVQRIACGGIGAAALWLVLAPGHLASILVNLSSYEIWSASVLSQSALVMAVGTLVFTLLSSWFLLRSEK